MANPVHIPRPTEADEARFWAKVRKGDDCWEWMGGKFTSGYGMFVFGGKLRRAHRGNYPFT